MAGDLLTCHTHRNQPAMESSSAPHPWNSHCPTCLCLPSLLCPPHPGPMVQADADMEALVAQAAAAGEVVRYVGVVDVAGGTAAVRLQQ